MNVLFRRLARGARFLYYDRQSCHHDTLAFALLAAMQYPSLGSRVWMNKYFRDCTHRPLERFIDVGDPLVALADRIDWDGLDEVVAERFAEAGWPGRFMAGMLILKTVENLSDEALWARWLGDPYCQCFTGELCKCRI